VPELIEVELYRGLADEVVGREVVAAEVPDAWFVKGGASTTQVADAVQGAVVHGTDRHGKLLVLDLGDDRPALGLRFGMTGRLVLDDQGPIDRLEYASSRDDPAWDRFALRFADGRRLRLSDPRRLGGVVLDPDRRGLGPDAWHLTVGELRRALAGSTAPLKARLLDQSRVAGLGNLLVDETLWRARLSPRRPAGSLTDVEVRRLRARTVATIDLLFARGGSHRGDLQAERHRDGRCPRCVEALERAKVGGRTTYWCSACLSASQADL
jgi:formamidopyrimidine-DNA glycosylase